MPADYWNHNTAFHPELVALAPGRRVLDVGCGDGLLVARLAAVAEYVTGIDPDAGPLRTAAERTAGLGNVRLIGSGLLEADLPDAAFDLVTVVATLHHLELEPALERLRDLVAPGGTLAIIGLAREGSPADLLVGALTVPIGRVMGWVRHESDPEVVFAEPRETLDQIRSAARRILPGARMRRRLYYRYSLRWRAPSSGGMGGAAPPLQPS